MKTALHNLVVSVILMVVTSGSVAAQGIPRAAAPAKAYRPSMPVRSVVPYRRPAEASSVHSHYSKPSPAVSQARGRAASSSRQTPSTAVRKARVDGKVRESERYTNRLPAATSGKPASPRARPNVGKMIEGAKALPFTLRDNTTKQKSSGKSDKLASPYAARNVEKMTKAAKALPFMPRDNTAKQNSSGKTGALSRDVKPDASQLKNLSRANFERPRGPAERRRPGGEMRPVSRIITDEDGVEHWESSWDEQLAIDHGGRYEWTDEDGNKYTTIVTEDGTQRTVTLPDGGGIVSDVFTPHERRDAAAEAGGNGVDTALGIVDAVLDRVAPFLPVPAAGGAAYYYDPGYLAPAGSGGVLPVEAGYGVVDNGQLIPEMNGAGDAAQRLVRFTRRYLQVKNNTDEDLVIHVQFRACNEQAEWVWLPADPDSSDDALVFELAPGQEGYLDHGGAAISSSRVRIWAQSATRQWDTYRDEDLWLVSEVDENGRRTYLAVEMEAFPFVFE